MLTTPAIRAIRTSVLGSAARKGSDELNAGTGTWELRPRVDVLREVVSRLAAEKALFLRRRVICVDYAQEVLDATVLAKSAKFRQK